MLLFANFFYKTATYVYIDYLFDKYFVFLFSYIYFDFSLNSVNFAGETTYRTKSYYEHFTEKK